MTPSRTAWRESLLAWMEEVGAPLAWIMPTHWGG